MSEYLDHIMALHRAIEKHCKNEIIPDSILNECPYFGKMMNDNLVKNKVSLNFYESYRKKQEAS